jgi:hypothetical protein
MGIQHDLHERLDRMEGKMDKMTDAIVALARVEEKLIGLEESNGMVMKQILDLNNKIIAVESKNAEMQIKQVVDGNTLTNLRKFFWMLVSSILGAICLYLFKAEGPSHPVK